jgi:protein SHQ1
MITPKFEIEQNDNFVIVRIFTPHIKLSTIEYVVNEKTFRFFVKPYFLRLTFEQEICESENSDDMSYDSETGSIVIKILKKNKTEFFTNLNMLTMLLSNQQKPEKKKVLIEMIEEEEIENGQEEDEIEDPLNDNFEFFEQKLNSFDEMIQEDVSISLKVTYGFDSMHS